MNGNLYTFENTKSQPQLMPCTEESMIDTPTQPFKLSNSNYKQPVSKHSLLRIAENNPTAPNTDCRDSLNVPPTSARREYQTLDHRPATAHAFNKG